MQKFLTAIGAIVVIVGVIALAAFFGGTILYFIWPVAIPAVFPKVVEGGWLAARLTWWQSVLFVWVTGVILAGAKATLKEKD